MTSRRNDTSALTKCIGLSLLLLAMAFGPNGQTVDAALRAGAAVVDVTPQQYPVLINGGMTSRSADQATTPVSARAIVVDDGKERIAMVIVDSCMMSREVLDDAKALAEQKTGIPRDHILIGATHTHSAPASMGCLGTDADPNYVPLLRQKLVEAVAAAAANLEPAQVGAAVANAADFTALRRWIRRPDRVAEDPFGNPTVRANMHAGGDWSQVTGESGPEDPDLSVLAFQSLDGRPIAVLANFSMHYFSGEKPVGADYFGRFSNQMQERLADDADGSHPPFVAMMSHGCSGDIWRRDYTKPESFDPKQTIDQFAAGLLEIAVKAYQGIKYDADATLNMAEARLQMKYRVPSLQLLEWSRRVVAEMGARLPRTPQEVYAREQIILHDRQSTEVVVQAIRIGDIGLETTPTETYALTGLKIKAQSPTKTTITFDLTNGGDGYIPPPEQHVLGGYNTWAARSAGLEVQAEPRFTEAALQLLEQVTGKSRKPYTQSRGNLAAEIESSRPVAWWRLDEFAGPRAVDSSGHNRDGIFEPGVVFFLEGPRSNEFCTANEVNRAAHFAGGRMTGRIDSLKDRYSVSMWVWNGMPVDARDISGWMFSRGRDHSLTLVGDHLGVSGGEHPGQLVFTTSTVTSQPQTAYGSTSLERWTWNHVVLVRDGRKVQVYLNGASKPEIELTADADFPPFLSSLFVGGRSDGNSTWEGRLDEVAVYDRPLTPAEIAVLSGQAK